MAIKKTQRGFALLIAVVFMSVMLTFGLALSSLAYKQTVLAGTALESQYAFYAADAAFECMLYYDQQQNFFAFPLVQPISAPKMTCDGLSAGYPPASPTGIVSYTPLTRWVITERLSIDTGKRCADVTIYKPSPGLSYTYLFSQGYNISCAQLNAGNVRYVTRGLKALY